MKLVKHRNQIGRKPLRIFTRFLVLTTIMLAAVACQDTGNTAQDVNSAQRLLPNLAAYTATDVDTAIDGAFTAVGGAALAGGQVEITAAVAKAEQMIQCFQDRGAIAAKFYTENTQSNIVPKVGAVLVINQTRVNQELLNCLLGGQNQSFSAQSVVEPCADSGNFTYQGDNISYVYVGSQPDVSALFNQHFTSVQQNNAGG